MTNCNIFLDGCNEQQTRLCSKLWNIETLQIGAKKLWAASGNVRLLLRTDWQITGPSVGSSRTKSSLKSFMEWIRDSCEKQAYIYSWCTLLNDISPTLVVGNNSLAKVYSGDKKRSKLAWMSGIGTFRLVPEDPSYVRERIHERYSLGV